MEPSIKEILLHIFLGFLTSPAQLIILLICIYYLIKSKGTTDSILLLVGSSITLLDYIFIQVGVLYAKNWGSDSYITYSLIVQSISKVGSLLFAIGLFNIVRKVLKIKISSQISKK